MCSYMLTITAVGRSVRKMQQLRRGRVVFNYNHTTRNIMTTFTRTGKLV